MATVDPWVLDLIKNHNAEMAKNLALPSNFFTTTSDGFTNFTSDTVANNSTITDPELPSHNHTVPSNWCYDGTNWMANDNVAISNTFHSWSKLVIYLLDKPVVEIDIEKGTIEYKNGYTTTEAVEQFWNSIAQKSPALLMTKIEQLQDKLHEALNNLGEQVETKEEKIKDPEKAYKEAMKIIK